MVDRRIAAGVHTLTRVLRSNVNLRVTKIATNVREIQLGKNRIASDTPLYRNLKKLKNLQRSIFLSR